MCTSGGRGKNKRGEHGKARPEHDFAKVTLERKKEKAGQQNVAKTKKVTASLWMPTPAPHAACEQLFLVLAGFLFAAPL